MHVECFVSRVGFNPIQLLNNITAACFYGCTIFCPSNSVQELCFCYWEGEQGGWGRQIVVWSEQPLHRNWILICKSLLLNLCETLESLIRCKQTEGHLRNHCSGSLSLERKTKAYLQFPWRPWSIYVMTFLMFADHHQRLPFVWACSLTTCGTLKMNLSYFRLLIVHWRKCEHDCVSYFHWPCDANPGWTPPPPCPGVNG